MTKLMGAAALAALVLAAATPATAQPSQPPAAAEAATLAARELAAVIADFEAFDRRLDPLSAGFEGDAAARALLPDLSREAELATRAPLQGFQDRLVAIDPVGLDDAGRLNRDFLAWVIQRRLGGIEFDSGRLAFDSEGGPGQSLAYYASVTRIRTQADGEAWLSRLEAAPRFYDQQLANARRGLETGFVQPRSVVESVLVSMRNEQAQPLESDALLAPFAALPATIPVEVQARWRERA
ncbi:MAG TPA: DUF885 family protein, partial [Caulobacteraceae bacterium]